MRTKSGLFSFLVVLTMLYPAVSRAIPAFARQYGTSCTTCHNDFPKLNESEMRSGASVQFERPQP